MMAAWARLTVWLTRCTCALLRDPIRMNGRCSGMPGLPAWAPCGMRTGIVGGLAFDVAAGCAAAGGLEDGGLTAMGALSLSRWWADRPPDLLSTGAGGTSARAASYNSACHPVRTF